MMRLSRVEMEELVQRALEELPDEFAALLDNVAVLVEDEPSDDDLESVGMARDEDDELFGLYVGVPLTERGAAWDGFPDQIKIFSGPIGRFARNRREAIREIRDTVIHELGHFFGMEEDQMPY
jgi:predicted Zn-dependent protease with MMP-like domain